MATIELQTNLDAPFQRVRDEVLTPRLLRYVAAPLVSFHLVDSPMWPTRWDAGGYRVRLRLFGFVPAGEHTIDISMPPPQSGREFLIRDNGSGKLASTWDHLITLEALEDGRTRYTDRIEVRAGWLTPAVALFARAFYAHRQRRWRKLVRRNFAYD